MVGYKPVDLGLRQGLLGAFLAISSSSSDLVSYPCWSWLAWLTQPSVGEADCGALVLLVALIASVDES